MSRAFTKSLLPLSSCRAWVVSPALQAANSAAAALIRELKHPIFQPPLHTRPIAMGAPRDSEREAGGHPYRSAIESGLRNLTRKVTDAGRLRRPAHPPSAAAFGGHVSMRSTSVTES